MTIELARAVFAMCGHHGPITALAEGASSAAWLGAFGDQEWVVRVPRGNSGRPRPDYASESLLNRALREAGAPATEVEVIEVDGVACSLAPRVAGAPIQPDQWTDEFVTDVAAALAATHSIPTAPHTLPDAVARFHLARIWPLDDTSLDDHPVTSRLPEVLDWVRSQEPRIREEAARTATVVHTDLHWDHLLRGDDGRLAGVLDYGDAFAGPPAWDLACLRYYHGETVATRVADRYPFGKEVLRRSGPIGIAFALYKLDKTPDRADVIERVAQLTKRMEIG